MKTTEPLAHKPQQTSVSVVTTQAVETPSVAEQTWRSQQTAGVSASPTSAPGSPPVRGGALFRNPVAAVIQRARTQPQTLTRADVMLLHSTIGNQAVGRLLMQAKSYQAQQSQGGQPGQTAPEPSAAVPPSSPVSVSSAPINATGLPDRLKAGVETLSGLSMDDVKVHRNSSQPKEVGALAYTQGTDIHVAPGQEQHLPHEAWHVVQQKQGRVQPTFQMKQGININDDASLETEADIMGKKAMSGSGLTKMQHTIQARNGKAVTQLTTRTEYLNKGINNRTIIKIVLPGSGNIYWPTIKTDQAKMNARIPIKSKTDQKSFGKIDKAKMGTRTSKKGEYTISGPLKWGGVRDAGANSIVNNIKLAQEYVLDTVEYLIEKGERPGNITILIKSHSRNAVAASQIAKYLAKYFKDFAEYFASESEGIDGKNTNKVEGEHPTVEVVMLDPVPGPGHSGELVKTDVEDVPQSTLVYSLITQHRFGFTPQEVYGATRLIISKQDHGVGTKSYFINKGEKYKGSALNNLDKGLYIGVGEPVKNEPETIVKIENIRHLRDFVVRETFVSQSARKNIILKVGEAWLGGR